MHYPHLVRTNPLGYCGYNPILKTWRLRALCPATPCTRSRVCRWVSLSLLSLPWLLPKRDADQATGQRYPGKARGAGPEGIPRIEFPKDTARQKAAGPHENPTRRLWRGGPAWWSSFWNHIDLGSKATVALCCVRTELLCCSSPKLSVRATTATAGHCERSGTWAGLVATEYEAM